MSLDNIRQLFAQIFDKAKEKMGDELKSMNRVFQFVLSDGTEFYLEISGGEYKIEQGRHPSPVATLSTDLETLEKILKGELDAMAAFIRGKLKITGNVIETTKLRQIIEAAKS
ncbi:MAG: SCP2 sterol-binding domain-containing protein [Thermoproteota archaeon]